MRIGREKKVKSAQSAWDAANGISQRSEPGGERSPSVDVPNESGTF